MTIGVRVLRSVDGYEYIVEGLARDDYGMFVLVRVYDPTRDHDIGVWKHYSTRPPISDEEYLHNLWFHKQECDFLEGLPCWSVEC